MTDPWKIAAELTGAILAALFLIYPWAKNRARNRPPKRSELTNPSAQPDAISRMAASAVRMAHWHSVVLTMVILGVVAYGFFVDSTVRMIVLITAGVMFAIVRIHRRINSPARKKGYAREAANSTIQSDELPPEHRV